MGRTAIWMSLIALIAVTAPMAGAGAIYEIDYATYDVKVTDTKGVVTDAREFGFFTGPNILMAKRGDAWVDIPFRKIKAIEVGTYIPSKGHYPATVTSRRGKILQVQIPRVEGQRYMGGDTDVGSYRIRLGQIQRLDLIRLSRTEDFE